MELRRHVTGSARLFENRNELIEHVSQLTAQNEALAGSTWQVSDAPREYIEAMAKAIVGVEIAIESMEGKWKVSQNRDAADRLAVVEALAGAGSDRARQMAALVDEKR